MIVLHIYNIKILRLTPPISLEKNFFIPLFFLVVCACSFIVIVVAALIRTRNSTQTSFWKSSKNTVLFWSHWNVNVLTLLLERSWSRLIRFSFRLISFEARRSPVTHLCCTRLQNMDLYLLWINIDALILRRSFAEWFEDRAPLSNLLRANQAKW